MTANGYRERMQIVIGGHVDHGKSTVIGRLLADTHSLPEGKLEQVKALCARTARPFEYAFLLDALKDEQAQGITIDAARVFFKTARRDYLIMDAPGHIEFLKNMVTGASRAEAALLVIDAKEGVRENSRRHGYLMSMLGVRNVAVLVNKMDLVGYSPRAFEQIEAEYRDFLTKIDVHPSRFIPLAARDGENISARSGLMPWYRGPTVLDLLDEFPAQGPAVDLPFRMPVQEVFKFTSRGDDRRIIAGTVETGVAKVGDEVIFYPSGKKTVIHSVEAFNRDAPRSIGAGEAAGFTLKEQLYVTRGEIATLVREPHPKVTTRLRVNLFWLGKQPLVRKKDYTLKLCTSRVRMRVEDIHRVIDASSLEPSEQQERVERYAVAECTLACNRAIAFDTTDRITATSRFVIVDDYEIQGGGIVREALPDQQSLLREKVLLRNYKWEPSFIPTERRAARFSQRATLVLITGSKEGDRKGLAKELEARLFEEGKAVYFLGIGNVLYGVDADITRGHENRQEHLRRLAEVANLMLDAGMILIVTAAELSEADLDLIRTSVDATHIETVWTGDQVTTNLNFDLLVSERSSLEEGVERIKQLLQDRGIIFRPW
jgi:bifunctional enzyme CysN/CysC